MSLKVKLQKELNETNYITRERLYKLSEEWGCDFDTVRNYLEPTKGMGVVKEYKEKNKIGGWRKVNPPTMFNEEQKLETPKLKANHWNY